jgi:hypothetical protein
LTPGDAHNGSPYDYWRPKMQCLAAAFEEWKCAGLLRPTLDAGGN